MAGLGSRRGDGLCVCHSSFLGEGKARREIHLTNAVLGGIQTSLAGLGTNQWGGQAQGGGISDAMRAGGISYQGVSVCFACRCLALASSSHTPS